MADRSVLFKYLNPNLAFVLAEGKESSNGKAFINVYLLDLVTGRIIFGANHKRVQGKIFVKLISQKIDIYFRKKISAEHSLLGYFEIQKVPNKIKIKDAKI